MNSPRQTDFIDTDLQHRQIPRPDFEAEDRRDGSRLQQLNQQRELLEEEVAGTARELESLRQQQENLLKRKQTLETLRQRQGQYVEEKQSLSRRIHQSLLLLNREEERINQVQQVYSESRQVFSRLVAELNELADGGWPEETFSRDLGHVQAALKAARMDFKRTLARLDALDWSREPETKRRSTGDQSFLYWLRAGLALALPIALLGALSALAVFWVLTKLEWGT